MKQTQRSFEGAKIITDSRQSWHKRFSLLFPASTKFVIAYQTPLRVG